METNEAWTGSDPTDWPDSQGYCDLHPHVRVQYHTEQRHRAVYCSACRAVTYLGVRYKVVDEIIKTWVQVANDSDLHIQGQRPDNGDWSLLQAYHDGALFIIIPVLDETGTPRIRVIREPSE